METAVHSREIRKDNPTLRKLLRCIIWILLILLAAFTLIPFVWMISSSLKLDREVFAFPMRWIPETFHWENYSRIWEKVPLLTYFKNTAFIAIVVTLLQTLTSSFAQGSHCDPGDLHVREYLERLHGPHDLPDPGREQDRAGGPAAVYPGELQRLPPDHGGFPLFAAAGFHRVPVPAAVLH